MIRLAFAFVILTACATTQPVESVDMYIVGGTVNQDTCDQAFDGVFAVSPDRMVEIDINGKPNQLTMDYSIGAYAGQWISWAGDGPFDVELTFDPASEGAPVTWHGSLRGKGCIDTMLGRGYRWQ